MNQPHIQEIGAFDPIEAFSATMSNMAKMMAGLKEDPQAIPAEEIMRAATVTVDLLETITQMSTSSVMSSLSKFVDHETFAEARATYIATRLARTPEEESEYRTRLMRKVAHYFPHESDFQSDD